MMKPMPLRPRLPVGGIEVASTGRRRSASISTELADTACASSCCHGKNEKAVTAPSATATATTSNNSPSFVEQPSGGRESNDASRNHRCHSPIPLENHSSFSNFDPLKFEDIGDDFLIHSTEPLNLDDSLMTLLNEESSSAPSLMDQTPVPVPDSSFEADSDTAHVLHRTVVLFPNDGNLVQTALIGSDPQAALTPCPVPHNGYSYPLHIALYQGANLPVLQLLVQAGPQVLMQKDGPQGFTPLMLALTHLPQRCDAHQILRTALPQAAGIACGEDHELPLHVACRNSSTHASVDIIQRLIQDYPVAVVQPNRRGLTPLNIVALQPATAPHRMIVYQSLQSAVFSQKPPTMGATGNGVHLTSPCQ